MTHKKNKNGGYILLETVISFGLLSIILFSASVMVFNFANTSKRLIKNNSQLENIRLAHYFLVNQILCCDKLKIKTDQNSTLKNISMDIWDDKTKKYIEHHTFAYKNSQLQFGGKTEKGEPYNTELAKNISDIKIDLDQQKKILKNNQKSIGKKIK